MLHFIGRSGATLGHEAGLNRVVPSSLSVMVDLGHELCFSGC